MIAGGAQATGESRRDRWVCLMYHDVLPSTRARGGGGERFAVPLTAFERTLDLIREQAFEGCSVADALAAPGTRRVAITFDDGTRSHFDHAAPALAARGMTATFYVTTSWVGRSGYVTWSELREMKSWGMSIQSHTHTHPFLSELSENDVRTELRESKALLDGELGQQTTELGLPGGDAPRRSLRRVIDETGYEIVAGSRWGVNRERNSDDRTRILRCTMRATPTDDWVRRVLDGDLVLSLQRLPREATLARIRATLGPTRYARWRRRLLDAVQPASAPS